VVWVGGTTDVVNVLVNQGDGKLADAWTLLDLASFNCKSRGKFSSPSSPLLKKKGLTAYVGIRWGDVVRNTTNFCG
jgi:hypothetical protein